LQSGKDRARKVVSRSSSDKVGLLAYPAHHAPEVLAAARAGGAASPNQKWRAHGRKRLAEAGAGGRARGNPCA